MRIFTKLSLFAAVSLAFTGAALAAPLTVVNVTAPAINCVFDTSCTLTPTDTVAPFPPASGYSGTPKLRTRTVWGTTGAPAAGLTGYIYRVDFTHAMAEADINCAVWMKIDFGPVATLNYTEGHAAQVFVITKGGLGTIGLSSATISGGVVTFNFATPVCPQNGTAPGQSSYFFGLASKKPPVKSKAKVDLTFGGGIVQVGVRVPKAK